MAVRPQATGISGTTLSDERLAALAHQNEFFIDATHADVRAEAAQWDSHELAAIVEDQNATREWYTGSAVQPERPNVDSGFCLAKSVDLQNLTEYNLKRQTRDERTSITIMLTRCLSITDQLPRVGNGLEFLDVINSSAQSRRTPIQSSVVIQYTKVDKHGQLDERVLCYLILFLFLLCLLFAVVLLVFIE